MTELPQRVERLAPKPLKVLAIDGGGIRGIVPALLLAEIEQRTRRPIASLFDLITGTSTGGILALGLTKPGTNGQPQYSAATMSELYTVNGPKLFSRSLWHTIRALGNLIDEKYRTEPLEDLMNYYLGDARLKDALTNVVIPSYELEQRYAFFFKSSKAKISDNFDFPMRLVARATSAAPTYFEPVQIESYDERGKHTFALIDGGVFANNPALCGYGEIKSTYPLAEDILLVSLGTGELTRPIHYAQAKNWGQLQWVQPIIDVAFDGVSNTVHYQLQQLLPPGVDGLSRYYRFQARLDDANDDLDDASAENIAALKRLSYKMIANESERIDVLCHQLVT